MLHRAHHYRLLVQRWRALARRSGLRVRRFAEAGGDPLIYLESPALAATGGIYISAAIHGDEAATSEALVTWAEKHASRLSRWPLLIFPCLNPWGLRNNMRCDAQGVDLNRSFHIDDNPVIAGLKRVAGQRQFEVAVMLHEDYDAEGFYLYEIQRERPHWGEDLLRVAARQMPVDPRERIDGRRAKAGLIRRRFDRALFERIGFPEAIWLHQCHAQRALTLETPSEFALEHRVRAHVAVIEECVRRVTTSPRRGAA